MSADETHILRMEWALAEAEKARVQDEVPIGAIVVDRHGEVIGRGHNLRESLNDPTAHAEIIAIREAAHMLKSWRLEGCSIYVTLEPCSMCAGAIILARIPLLVYGATDPKAGACESLYRITDDARLNHRPQVIAGVLRERCGTLLSDFFAAKRLLGKK